jgi:hypothetical protein
LSVYLYSDNSNLGSRRQKPIFFEIGKVWKDRLENDENEYNSNLGAFELTWEKGVLGTGVEGMGREGELGG